MTFENARFADAGAATILATVEGIKMTIPVDPANRHYQALLAAEVEVAAVEPPALAEALAAALVEVDRQAEAVRLLYLTDGAGQAQEYAQTEGAAVAAIAASAASFDGYPMLKAERDAVVLAAGGDPEDAQLGPDVQQVAAEVIAQRDAWLTVGAAIKTERRRAKLALEAAADTAAVDAILAGLTWPGGA